MAGSGEHRDTETAMLAAVFELTLLVAQAGAKQQPPVDPPAVLRPFMKFRKGVPTAALRAARTVLESDASFRERLAPAVTDELVGRAGVLFVRRPDGWREELDRVVAEEDALAEHLAGSKREQASLRKIEDLEAVIAKQERAQTTLQKERDAATALVASERNTRESLTAELNDARQGLRSLTDKHDAVTAEREALITQLRTASEEVAQLRKGMHTFESRETATIDVARRVDDAVSAVQAVHAALLLMRDEIGRDAPWLTVVEPSSNTGSSSLSSSVSSSLSSNASTKKPRTKPARRQPIALPGGVLDDSAEAASFLLRVPMVTVLVDGYNVAKLRWPDANPTDLRDRLLNASVQLAARTGAAINLVFDGQGGTATTNLRRNAGVRMTFAPASSEADDLIIELVAAAPITAPIVVVSNDRRVLDGARELGANVLRSPLYIAAWSRLS